MASENEIMQLCRLCLVKEQVNVPIFDEQSDIRQIFLKISACLPVKVSREDNLPKKICDDCSYKLEVVYQFWNTSATSEKQLLKWLNQLGAVSRTSDKTSNSHSLSSEPLVNLKQEVVELNDTQDHDNLTSEDLDQSNESYILQQQQHSYQQVEFPFQDGFGDDDTAAGSSAVISETVGGRPKRKRRAAAMKALPPQLDSDDEDDMLAGKIAKTEEQSDDSGEDPEPTTFVGLPSTSTDDQPGPSGIGKGNSEAPFKKSLENTAVNGNQQSKKKKPGAQKNALIKNPKLKISKNSSKNFSKNENVQDEKIFECWKCDEKFEHLFEVKMHCESTHKSDRTFECQICDKIFHKKQLFQYHQARHFKNYKIKCDQCEKGFYTMLDYKRHYSVRHKGVRFVCDHCTKSFLDQNNYKRHVKTHQSGYVKEEYKCKSCDKVYHTKGSLNVHLKMHKNISYICDICGKSVTSKTSLNHHIMLHTGEKPFVCEICGKCFNKKMLLKIHTRIHTNVKPYTCTICDKTFSQRSTLTVHMRYHTGDKPFKCNICQKQFVTKTFLKVHSKTHGTALIDV